MLGMSGCFYCGVIIAGFVPKMLADATHCIQPRYSIWYLTMALMGILPAHEQQEHMIRPH